MAGAGREDFEARLKRLEQKVAAADTATPAQPTLKKGKHSASPGTGRRVVIVLALLGLLGSAALAAWQYRQSPFDLVPSGLETDLAALRGWLSGSPPEADPTGPAAPREASRQQTYQGWTFASPGVASAALTPLILSDIATGLDAPHPAPADPQFVSFDPNPECTLRTPARNEVLHNIRLESGTVQTDLHVFSNAEMAEALITHIEGVTSGHSGNYKIGTMAEGRMSAVDVFVTDTTSPVYLLLQGFRANTIWNLHLAEGVTLAHVAMIGERSAVAGLPEGSTFEALRISDFVQKDEFGSNDEIRPCMVAPWRMPQADWLAVKEAATGNKLFENRIYSYNAGHRAFAAWYATALGRAPDENLVAVERAAHVLAGPVPETPVRFSPLSGRTLQITADDHIVAGDDQLALVHDTTLAAAVGGDIAMLDPAPMERPIQ